MLSAIRDQPKFSKLFMNHLLSRNSRIQEDVIDQLFDSSEKRLARLLLLLANYGKAGRRQEARRTGLIRPFSVLDIPIQSQVWRQRRLKTQNGPPEVWRCQEPRPRFVSRSHLPLLPAQSSCPQRTRRRMRWQRTYRWPTSVRRRRSERELEANAAPLMTKLAPGQRLSVDTQSRSRTITVIRKCEFHDSAKDVRSRPLKS